MKIKNSKMLIKHKNKIHKIEIPKEEEKKYVQNILNTIIGLQGNEKQIL